MSLVGSFLLYSGSPRGNVLVSTFTLSFGLVHRADLRNAVAGQKVWDSYPLVTVRRVRLFAG